MHEIFRIAFKDSAMGRKHTFEYFSQLKSGESSIEDCGHSGHFSSPVAQKKVNLMLSIPLCYIEL